MTVALLAIHGMGNTQANFADEFKSGIRKRLGQKWQNIHFESVYYQAVLQGSKPTCSGGCASPSTGWGCGNFCCTAFPMRPAWSLKSKNRRALIFKRKKSF